MKTLAEVLRDADPVGYEPPWDAHQRHMSRQIIVTAPRGEERRQGVPADTVEQLPRRMVPVAAMVALALVVTVAIGSQFWSPAVEAAVRFEVRLAEEHTAIGLTEVAIPGTDRRVHLYQDPIVTNSDIARAQVVPGNTPSTFWVSVEFSSEGTTKIFLATQGHIGRPVAILIDGEVLLAPVVRSPIGNSAVVSGDFTKAEAERIVAGVLGR